ncbi:histidine triad protein HinT [[Mycoplasma] mobile]|uniref:HIT-family hydrolase protein n=1 Tax=Mycoplasma mobile (strain ATCC 43663 / 163K / NCTC 11711) TaxID=267748 RepID=Q6KIK1_MYCM1|nr:HIT domain-containing protein [[Mycoplasma] mobile]AAT27575.1 HIT-family hydrolase protein [Mycoplasma mobile 163K]
MLQQETIFQKIINKEVPAKIIYEDSKTIAFLDIKPISKGHFLVVPKNFSRNLISIDDEDLINLMMVANKLAKKFMKENKASGYQLHVNNESDARQVVFHTHVHIIFSYPNELLSDQEHHFNG